MRVHACSAGPERWGWWGSSLLAGLILVAGCQGQTESSTSDAFEACAEHEVAGEPQAPSSSLPEECDFTDPQLEKAVDNWREYTEDGSPAPLVHLTVPADVESLEGISCLESLEYVSIEGTGEENSVLDLSPLGQLPRLSTLWIWRLRYSGESALTRIPLQSLAISGEVDSLIELLPRFCSLEFLSVSSESLKRLSRLAPNLKHLTLYTPGLVDLDPLSEICSLEELVLYEGRLESLSGIEACHSLRALYVGEGNVADLKPLAGLPLSQLSIAKNNLTDLAPLGGLPLEGLSVSDNPVGENLGPLSSLSSLTGLALERCGVKDLEPLGKLGLSRVFLTGNEIEDVTPLSSMDLYTLDLSGNQIAQLPEDFRGAAREPGYPVCVRTYLADNPLDEEALSLLGTLCEDIEEEGRIIEWGDARCGYCLSLR